MGGLRLTLALCVVVAHVAPRWPQLLIRGDLAVEIFFMISGFYMALVLSTTYRTSKIEFWVARLLRIFPLYWMIAGVALIFAIEARRVRDVVHHHRHGRQCSDTPDSRSSTRLITGAWLNGSGGAELLRPAAEDRLRLWPVSRRVNKTGNGDDDPMLIEEG